MSRGSALLLVVAGGAAFATSGPLAWWAKPAHPLLIVFGRLALAAIVLVAVDVRGIASSLRTLGARQRRGIVAAGLLLAAHFICFVWGLSRTSLPAAVSLVSLEPLSVVLLAWLLQGLRPTPLEQLGIGLATLGALVIGRGAGQGEHRLDGDLLILAAVLLYGLYIAGARAWRGQLPATRYAAMVYTCAAIPTGLCLPWLPSFQLSSQSAIAIVLLALIPTLVGHTLVQAAAQRVAPAIVALVSPGETLGGLAIAVLLMGAQPKPVELVGAAIVVAGACLAILGTRR